MRIIKKEETTECVTVMARVSWKELSRLKEKFHTQEKAIMPGHFLPVVLEKLEIQSNDDRTCVCYLTYRKVG